MARERMVTRTINILEVNALCVDLITTNTTNQVFELTGVDLKGEALLKAVKKAFETDTFKIVAVTDTNTREELYGMSELAFIKYAFRLDPETRKAVE